MGLSEEDRTKLKAFSNVILNRNQIDIILGRQLTNAEWKSMTKDYRKIFTPIAKQAANIANRKGYLKPNYAKIFRDIVDQQIKREHGSVTPLSLEPTPYLKNKFKRIAAQTAKIAKIKQIKVDEEPEDKFHSVKSLFKNSENRDLNIIRLSEYYSSKYKTRVF